MLGVAPLSNGFALPAKTSAIITETELYAGTLRAGRRAEVRPTSIEAWCATCRS